MGCNHSKKEDVVEKEKLPTDLKSVMGENLPHNVKDRSTKNYIICYRRKVKFSWTDNNSYFCLFYCRYSLGELLGEGGYSKVYLGISKTALQQKVAIKMVTRASLQNDDEVGNCYLFQVDSYSLFYRKLFAMNFPF